MHTYDSRKDREVKAGEVRGGAFIKKVIPEKHYHRLTKSYAIQTDVLERLRELKVKVVKCVSKEETLYSLLSDWTADDIRVINYGSGDQRFLPLARMKTEADWNSWEGNNG